MRSVRGTDRELMSNPRPPGTPADDAVSQGDQQIIRRTFGFVRGIAANPAIARDIPEGAVVVLAPDDDPGLAEIENEAGMLALSWGMDVNFRHVRPGDIILAAE
jgi:hypothetical protein